MNCKIVGCENGPLEVDCADTILSQNGKKIACENPAYLCRCGHSKNKPWCDGSHVAAGFSSSREIEKEVIQVYEGKELTITFNRSICAGAAACVNGLPTVFSSGSSTDWIAPDNAETEAIIETIKACPSGALSYILNVETVTDSRSGPKITVVKNGPYLIEGIRLESVPTPTNFSPTKYALCRCGHSKNRPYCDYSHAQKSWSDEEA